MIEACVACEEGPTVLGDTPGYRDTPGLSHNAPDVALMRGLRTVKEQHTSFHVSMEVVRPELIIEVVSPQVRNTGTETKLAGYHAARVQMYVIIDRRREEDWPSILAYRWAAAEEYEPLALDDRDSISFRCRTCAVRQSEPRHPLRRHQRC